jgi:hypothetical protein
MKPMNFVIKVFAASALLGTASLAAAASITYYVERFLPTASNPPITYLQASKSGSITTNGKIGLLSQADILAFDFSVKFPRTTETIKSPALCPNGVLQIPVEMDGVVADSTSLSLDVSLSNSGFGRFAAIDNNSVGA